MAKGSSIWTAMSSMDRKMKEMKVMVVSSTWLGLGLGLGLGVGVGVGVGVD